MAGEGLANGALFYMGPFPISRTVVTTWGIMICLSLFAVLVSHKLKQYPGRWQSALEGFVVTIESAIGQVVPPAAVRVVLPFVATLWVFVVIANLVGLLPEMQSPTRDLSATAALAVLVFLSTHWFGIRRIGLKGHLKHYVEPSPMLLPFHVIGEITRTLALAVRLFGNMMSLEMAALLILLIAGFLVPVPLLILHVVEALVQAYIFGMLALIYIAGAIEATESSTTNSASESHSTEGEV